MKTAQTKNSFTAPHTEIEQAFLTIGILTFNYYPQERIMIPTKSFCDFFNCPDYLDNMPDSLAEVLIHENDYVILSEIVAEIDKGNTKVSANLRTKTGFLSRVTVVATKFDEKGKILETLGIVQKLESDILLKKTVEALSSDYSSIYYIDLEKNKTYSQRLSDDIEKLYGNILRNNPPYEKMIFSYIDEQVIDEEKQEMKDICSVKNLEKILKNQDVYLHDYRIIRNGEIRYCRMKIVNLSDKGEFKYLSFGFSDMTTHKTLELERFAFVDPVTGGNNYNCFKKKLKESDLSGYIISVDFRNFKLINTVCGVKRGDKILQLVNQLFDNYCENGAVCGHINADHFVIFAPNKSEKEVIRLTESLTIALLELSAEQEIPKLIPYFGITKWSKEIDIETAFSQTTIAKHGAKNLKDQNYLFYTDEETRRILYEKVLEDSFQEALKNNKFEVWYQPKFNPEDKSLVGAEALVRWRKRDGTYLQPYKFIPLFESDGLIKDLDEYVFTSVCELQKKRKDEGKKLVPISVNLSRASIYFGDVVKRYKSITSKIGIEPEFIPIEITESAAVANEDVLIVMERFHKVGFPIFMDDFGTGYSSLSTLNTFHFDALKIDKSLIDYIGDYSGDKLLEHTIGLSKELGINITAEGVETQKQVDFLKKLNCDNIQGFFYSKPLCLKDFLKLCES